MKRIIERVTMAVIGVTAGVAMASYDLDADKKLLTIVVSSGEETFDDANYATYLTNNSVTNVIKDGDGELVMGSADRSAYTGDFTIKAGTLSYAGNYAIGSLDTGSRTVFVKNGATLASKGGALRVDNVGTKTVYFEGWGVDNQGALWATGQIRNPWGQSVAMTGDALITGDGECGFTYGTIMEMAGHTLFVRQRTDNNVNFMFRGMRYKKLGTNTPSPGTIIVEKGRFYAADGWEWQTSGDVGKLILSNSTYFIISGFYATAKLQWPWIWDSDNPNFYLHQNKSDMGNTPYQIWQGPFEIRGVPVINMKTLYNTPRNADMSFAGKVSGGGFYLQGSGNMESTTSGGNPHLHLLNKNNDFTNGVAATLASVHFPSNGALPALGGNLILTNSAAYFNEDETYSLPGLEVSGTGMVSNAKGTWSSKGVVKRGVGELRYDSNLRMPALTVEGGSIRLPALSEQKGNPLAGLIGGVTFGYYSGCYGKFVTTNLVELSPAALYDTTHTHRFLTEETYDAKGGTNSLLRVITYAGYLWNRTDSTVTWNFAGCCVMHFAFYVNGVQEIYVTDGNGEKSIKKDIELNPGANYIQIRVYAKAGGGTTKNKQGGDITWDNKGFPCYMECAGGSDNQDDYKPLVDPGDGSLLTWCLPTEEPPENIPGSETPLTFVSDIPDMTFAAGTSINMNGLRSQTDRLAGFTTIENCSKLTVGESWSLKASDIAAGGKLTTDGKLIFADGAKLIIDKSACVSGEYVVAEATDGIEGDPDLEVESGAVWKKTIANGKITLTCPSGFMVIIR